MPSTDITLHQPSTFRSGQAKADRQPFVETAPTATSSAHRPTSGRPAVARGLTGGAADRPANWRVRIASVARQRPAKARADGSWSPRLVPDPSASHDDLTSRSRGVTRAGAVCAGRSALDSSRPRVAHGPGAQGQHGHDATRLTKRQLQFIHALARECDVEPAELEWRSRQLFGAGVATLSRDGAKILIDRLARALDAVA